MMVKLIYGDCLERMKDIPDGSIDMVLSDPPYGITSCKWDSIIPLKEMWLQLERITKINSAMVFTASQPFTTTLIHSNLKLFKYCWVWVKSRPTGHIHAKNKPLKKHEDICVFSKGVILHKGKSHKRMNYYPQGLIKVDKISYRPSRDKRGSDVVAGLRPSHKKTLKVEYENYPNSILNIKSEHNVNAYHPTQKPVELMEYLIKTYTIKGNTVLDFAMGSGTTGVACRNLDREFIGIEINKKYFEIAQNRLK